MVCYSVRQFGIAARDLAATRRKQEAPARPDVAGIFGSPFITVSWATDCRRRWSAAKSLYETRRTDLRDDPCVRYRTAASLDHLGRAAYRAHCMGRTRLTKVRPHRGTPEA